MNTTKRIKQLLEEILTELDIQRMNIDLIDDYCSGEYDGFIGASKIVEHIGSKYIKEYEEYIHEKKEGS